jgi:hypothetical protein
MEYRISGSHKPNKIKFVQLEAASCANIPILTSDVQILCSRIAKDQYDENLARAAVRSYFFNIDYSIDYRNEGWQKFVLASKIRHRLTHPSKIGDVDLSQEDFNIVALGAKWFVDRQNEVDRLKHDKHLSLL